LGLSELGADMARLTAELAVLEERADLSELFQGASEDRLHVLEAKVGNRGKAHERPPQYDVAIPK
jgi:hypothetical protein